MIEVAQPDRQRLYVVVDGLLEVGRECDGLLLADPEVSRRHARFASSRGMLTVEDLGSRNGTTVDGHPVIEPIEVRPGQAVQLGATEVRLAATGHWDPPDRQTAQLGTGRVDRGTVMSSAKSSALSPGGPAGAAPPAPAPDRVVRAQGGEDAARMTSIEAVARSIDSSRADVAASMRGGADTVTIVFSDIESSTEQAMRMGDQRWFEVLGIHNDIVRRNVTTFGGTEIKSQGDGFMLTFPSARKAVQFCISVQQELGVHARRSPEDAVRIRIGLHTGEAIVDEEGDLFGKHIIIAARIANLAVGGQILASGVVQEIASSRGDLEFGPAQSVELKGIADAYTVHPVVWQD
jgi:class 3 adenylate cyclase